MKAGAKISKKEYQNPRFKTGYNLYIVLQIIKIRIQIIGHLKDHGRA
jgi:hypothetical protein